VNLLARAESGGPENSQHMSSAAFPLNRAPSGYLDVRPAIAAVRRRMFTSEIPVAVLKAAQTNVARGTQVPVKVRVEANALPFPDPARVVVAALLSGDLKLFIYAKFGQTVIPAPVASLHIALQKAAIIQVTKGNVAFRFMAFYPRELLNDLEVPGFEKASFDRFALCIREKHFIDWLARSARQLCWPIDLTRRLGPGRPRLISIVKPIVKELIENGQWRQGMLLKELVVPIQLRIEGEKVDRETVKKALDELYTETGDLTYRYVRRKRRASAKPKASRG
jgi:hypothetical protein